MFDNVLYYPYLGFTKETALFFGKPLILCGQHRQDSNQQSHRNQEHTSSMDLYPRKHCLALYRIPFFLARIASRYLKAIRPLHRTALELLPKLLLAQQIRLRQGPTGRQSRPKRRLGRRERRLRGCGCGLVEGEDVLTDAAQKL